jgi:hypothetical protein
MFFRNTVKTVAVSVALLAFGAQAKTFKYELHDLNSSPAYIDYPGLDLSGASSASLTVELTEYSDQPVVTSLEVNYPHVSSLSVTNFKEYDGLFRASVSDVWLYRELNIEMSGLDVFNPNYETVNIHGFVSESNNFIKGEHSQDLGQPLFHVYGRLVDVTPSKVVDFESLTVNENRLELSLKDNMAFIPKSDSNEMAFVIDSLWFGKGEETLYFPAPLNDEAWFFKPYGLDVSTISGPDGDEYFIKIMAKDKHGNEFESIEVPLQDLLNQAYQNGSHP